MQRPSLISPSPGVIPGNEDHSPGPVPPSPAGPPCLRGFFMPFRFFWIFVTIRESTCLIATLRRELMGPAWPAGLRGECPPASACGEGLLLDFAPKACRPRQAVDRRLEKSRAPAFVVVAVQAGTPGASALGAKSRRRCRPKAGAGGHSLQGHSHPAPVHLQACFSSGPE